MNGWTILLVGLGAAVGAPLRYLADSAARSRFDSAFPWGTLLVNVVGALLLVFLSWLAYLVAKRVVLRTRIEHGGALLQAPTASLLRLDIIDDGEGVPESLRNLLFLPMVTGKRGGTGLGLALSQQIAASHGGLISYEPAEPKTAGSQFSLYLPLERQAREAA